MIPVQMMAKMTGIEAHSFEDFDVLQAFFEAVARTPVGLLSTSESEVYRQALRR
jgi:hypothetical protein